MSALSDIADAVDSLVTAGGIIVGGVFTYYKFFKDRIYRPRLELTLEGSRLTCLPAANLA